MAPPFCVWGLLACCPRHTLLETHFPKSDILTHYWLDLEESDPHPHLKKAAALEKIMQAGPGRRLAWLEEVLLYPSVEKSKPLSRSLHPAFSWIYAGRVRSTVQRLRRAGLGTAPVCLANFRLLERPHCALRSSLRGPCPSQAEGRSRDPSPSYCSKVPELEQVTV